MKSIIKNNFIEGLIWNYGSVAILSASGFLINFLIVYFYDAAVLGIFNRALAWYGVFSQITVWGVHMSVMRLIPEYKDNRREREQIISSALIGVFPFSAFCVVIIEFLLPFIVTSNYNLLISMQILMPGLAFFSVNKILLNYLNGLSEMKPYAVFQSLRYILIVLTVFGMGILRCHNKWLTVCFTASEIVVFFSIAAYLIHRGLFIKKPEMKYLKRHARFGTYILMSNLVTELNTKVDIICLGFIVGDDYLIGIYSFAVLFAEGFYQLYFVIRRSVNPKITEYYVDGKLKEGVEKINAGLKKILRILSPMIFAALIAGYYIMCCILNQRDYLAGMQFLVIIGVAIIVSGRKIILGDIFAQTGLPAKESFINFVTVACNFTLNVILIVWIGLTGAALATAASYLIYGYTMRHYVRKQLKVVI